jgi:hypothetical protein
MKNILSKIGDTLLFFAGFLAISFIFTGIVSFGKPAGKLSHCPLDFFAKSSRSYSATVLP